MKQLNPEQIELKWDNVLVRQEELVQQTQSGIVIAGAVKKEDNSTFRGTVIQVGPGRTDQFGSFREMEFQVGDEVLYPAHWTRSFVIGATNFDVLQQDRIYGKIN